MYAYINWKFVGIQNNKQNKQGTGTDSLNYNPQMNTHERERNNQALEHVQLQYIKMLKYVYLCKC